MKMYQKLMMAMVLVFTAVAPLSAQIQNQKFAYVDTDYILKNIPEYNDAQEELNALSQKWEKEVKAIYDKVEEMYKAYQAEAVLLPQDLKNKREDDIIKKEKEAKDCQKK